MDPVREKLKGRVIDYDTKLPIKGAMYGSEFTNDSGNFDLTIYRHEGTIDITKNGYKPFNLKIEHIYNNGDFKSFTLYDKSNNDNWTTKTYKNSHSLDFKVINGDSIIIELKKE